MLIYFHKQFRFAFKFLHLEDVLYLSVCSIILLLSWNHNYTLYSVLLPKTHSQILTIHEHRQDLVGTYFFYSTSNFYFTSMIIHFVSFSEQAIVPPLCLLQLFPVFEFNTDNASFLKSPRNMQMSLFWKMILRRMLLILTCALAPLFYTMPCLELLAIVLLLLYLLYMFFQSLFLGGAYSKKLF